MRRLHPALPLSPLLLSLALAAACTPAAQPPVQPAPAPPPDAAAPAAPQPGAAASAAPLPYPKTRTVDAVESRFGLTARDPYRWLEDGSSPEVQAWIHAQDRVAREYLAKLPGRDALRDRIRALAYLEWVSPPRKRGERRFYSRKEATREKRVVYWKQGDKGEERVLLDPATLSPDGSTALGVLEPSWDGKTVAYVTHPNNADAGVIRVKDVASGKVSDVDVIGGAKYADPQWTATGDGFYYVALPTDPKIPASELPGHSEVKLHKLGTPASADPVVFPKTGNPETELEANLSRDGRWLFVSVIRGASITELHYRDMRQPKSAWVPLVKGHDGTMAAIAWKDQIYLRTTEGAPRGRVFKVDPAKPARDAWKEIVPEAKDAVLEDLRVVGGQLALTYVKNAQSALEIRTLDGAPRKGGAIALPGIGTTWGVLGEPDDDTAYYSFTSFTTPGTIYQLSVKSGESKPWYAVKAPLDPGPYETEQVWYPSKDGTKVSMFVVRRKGAPRDGSTPFYLTGYGGFNVSMTPSFRSSLFVWLEAGGGLAMPNLRGGGEYGEAWHQAGMLTRKQNGFDDFIAAAEYLIQSGHTRAERLVISGGSNGGLLVGAAMTQRPELFRAVLCAVPVLDMLRFPLHGDGKTWIPEYGSPENPEHFKALLAYSPVHRVKPGTPYPAVLIDSADADDRVAPLHAWKMTAALQAASSSGRRGRPVIMRIEEHAGHGGADQVKSQVEAAADNLAFALHAMDVRPALPAK